MKKLLFILMTLLSIGANAQSITEVIYPQYVQGVGSSNASDDRKVPYACRMTVSGLTASATYRFYPRFVADPLLNTNGQGNMIFANQTGNFIRTTSPSLAVAGRYGEFTTDATGSYTGWFIVEPSLALEYQPGTTLYFRLMLNNGAGGGSVATRITATNSVTVLGWGSGASQGTGLRASGNTNYIPKNFMFLFNGPPEFVRPLSGTFIESDGTDNNASTSGYAPFYANNVDNVNNTWGTIIPNNLPNGVQLILQYSLSTGNRITQCISSNGVYGSTNTANANGGLNELVLSCVPTILGPTCDVTAAISGTNVLCNGASTGAANLTVTGATAPVTYAWSNGATTEDLTGIPAGTYSVTVTDANSCTATANVTITQNTALVAASTVGAAILCANGTTTVTVTATGGTAPYTGTGTFTAPAGAYSYTVTDANGCTSVTTGTINAPAALVASATFAPILCNGGTTSVTVSATGGTAPYTGTGTFTRSAGAYTYTVTDANGCTSVASGTISQPTLLVASFTIAPIPCDGSNTTVTVSATGGTAPYTGTGTFSRAEGSFSYTVTDANGCTKVVTGIVNRLLASSASAGVIACGQTTTTVTVSASEGTPPYTGTGSFTVGAGAYSYTVTDANGCTSVSSGTVAPPVCLTLTGVHYPQFVQGVGSSNAADDRKVPYAARMTVGGLNPSTLYRYYPRFVADPTSNTNGQGNYILANQSGNFTRVTSATLATAGRYGEFTTDATGSFTGWFVVEPSLALEFQPGTTLYLRLMINNGAGGGSVAARITATESVTVLGWGSASNQGTGLRSTAVPAYTAKNFVMLYNNIAGTGRPLSGTFIESDGTDNNAITSGYAPFYANNVDGVAKTWGTIIPNNLSNGINNISQFSLADGSFINKCTAANGVYGSTNTANANGGLTELVIGCTPLGNCAVTASIAGTNVLCNGASTGAANLTVTGATAPVTYVWSNSATTEDLTGIPAGTYSVTVTDANNCTATANVTIGQPTALVAASTVGAAILCNGGTTTVTVSATGGTAPYTGTGTFTTGAGAYSYTVTDANGCTSVTTGNITQPTALVAASSVTGPAILCSNGTTTVTVTATGGTAPYTGTGTFTLGSGAYSYTVTDANGCTSVTTGTVNAPAALVASATFAPILCNGGTTSVTVSATGGTAPYTGTGTFTRSAGAYTYTVTDANGCTSVASGTITQPTALVASFVISPIPCDGSNATVTVSATGGTAPYSGTGAFSRPAGLFSFTVTDANGCTRVVSGIVNRTLVASSIAGVIACGQTTTTVTVSASEGTAPYTGAGTFSVPAGPYSFTITDANGCTATTTGTVEPPVCLTLTGVQYPLYVQGVGSSNAADDRKVPYGARMTVGGLTPSTTYRYYPRFVADPASNTNGQGNYILANQSGNFTRVSSASLSVAGRYGEFTTDASGSFTGWFIVEPSLALEFQPGTTLYLRLMLNNGAGGGSVANRVTATESVTVLGWGSASNQGTGLRSTTVNEYTAKNFIMLYNNIAGSGRPVSGTFIESDGTDNSVANGYAPFYANSVDGVAKTWGTIIPNNLSNGINNISQFSLADGSFINKCTAANGVYGSTNTANANGGLTELVIGCTPVTGNCDVTVGQISGPANACAYTGASGLLATYTVSSNDAAPGFTWTIPAGATSVSGQGTNTISFRYPTGYAGGNISVVVTSVCAAPETRTFAVTTSAPVAPEVSGPTNICPFIGTAQQLTYSVVADPAAISYQWTVPPTVTLVSGQGTNSINITIGNGFIANANKVIKVRSLSSCGNSSETLYYLLAQLPSTPGSISGPVSICEFIGTGSATYSVAAVAGASSYIWTAQAGTTITYPNGNGVSGNTVNISFPAGFTTSSITVQAVNDCGTSSARSLQVVRSNPSTPSLISGPTNPCTTNSGLATYSINPVAGATSYTWTAPAGTTLTSVNGPGANDVVVNVQFPVSFTTGTISVVANNGCGSSAPRKLNLSRLNPATPGVIDASQTATCSNRVYTYSIAGLPSNSTSVVWDLSASTGGIILTGQGTTSITVSYPSTAINGTVSVRALNYCSQSVVRSLTIRLAACPTAPPVPFAGTSNNGPEAKVSGVSASEMMVNVYPNPTTTDFKMQVITAAKEEISVRVLDIQGRLFNQFTVMPYQTVNLGAQLKAGAYLVEVRQGKQVKTTRVLKF